MNTPSDLGDRIYAEEMTRSDVEEIHLSKVREGSGPVWVVNGPGIGRTGDFRAQLWLSHPEEQVTFLVVKTATYHELMDLLPQGLRQEWDSEPFGTNEINLILHTYPPHPRPTAFTYPLKCEAVRRLVVQLRECGEEVPRAAEDIMHCLAPHMDGYALARTLESRFGWRGSSDLVDALDGASGIIEELLVREQRGWVRDNAISPPYPDGTRVRLPHGESGVLDGVYEYGPAQYRVKLDGDAEADGPHQRRRIVRFEDAVPVPDKA